MNKPHTKFLCQTCCVKAEPTMSPIATEWFGNCQQCGAWEPLYAHCSQPVLYLKINE
jgi:predicted ATP-dependent serine protease